MSISWRACIRTLLNESHHITDPYTLSLSSFYTLHHIIIVTQSHHQVSSFKCFLLFNIYENVSCMGSSQQQL